MFPKHYLYGKGNATSFILTGNVHFSMLPGDTKLSDIKSLAENQNNKKRSQDSKCRSANSQAFLLPAKMMVLAHSVCLMYTMST